MFLIKQSILQSSVYNYIRAKGQVLEKRLLTLTAMTAHKLKKCIRRL